MAFIRKIKKGKYTYLAEVEGKRINGKVVQKHIRYIGREKDGKIIKSGSIETTEVTKVTIWAPILAAIFAAAAPRPREAPVMITTGCPDSSWLDLFSFGGVSG